jgi:PHD/YefM family antitoxin component YafN of YafNO toxin-antitoxin module
MQTAQEAAEHYLEEVRLRADNEEQLILSEAKEKAAAIIAKAEKEAAMLTVHPKERENGYDSVIDTILNKYRRDE